MKPFIKLLMATMALVCLSQNTWAFQSPTLPYDLFLVGIDSDVNASGEDQIILLTARDISNGYKFGITNALSDNSVWTTKHASIEYANFKYIGGDPILKGSAIKLSIQNNKVEIEIDNKSVSDQFEIELSTTYSGDFISSGSFYFSVFSGIMTKSINDAILLGTTLDVVVYGITESKARDILLDASVNDKEILIPSSNGTLSTAIDRNDCDLCEYLITILFSENWLNLPNTYGFDLDSINFDIKDCIEVDCDKDLVIDELDCFTLHASFMPCDSVEFYQWSKVVDGQLVPVLTGDSAPIPNLELESPGTYQLHITCTNGCREISNRITPTCFTDGCDADINVSDCVASVSLAGCPNAQYQWYVQTEEDTYMIEGANSSSVTAEENGTYFVKITGCPNCVEITSPSIDMNCGENCDCNIDFYQQDCLLYFDTTGCVNFTGYLEYFSNTSNQWIYIGAPNSPYDPSEFGNGLYQIILSSEECSDTLAQEYVDCISPCSEVILTPTFNENCNLVFNWKDCFNPTFSIQYAQDCSNYSDGGAVLISSSIYPDGSGSAEYQPIDQQGCYQLLLNCNEECNLYSDKIELSDCCESELTIDTSNCIISVTDIPCSGSFTYSLYANGEIVETGSNSSNFSINIDQNAIYQLIIECDGCSFFSNTINADCGVIECEPPLLNIGECVLTAIIENCNNPQIQWQEHNGTTWLDIQGETNTTYEIAEDGTFRYKLVGCSCVNEPLYSIEYTSNCNIVCNCDINIWKDIVTCEIHSTNPGCELILSIEWYYEESPGNWSLQPQFSGQNSIAPNLNGKYKKIIKTRDCGERDAEIDIYCVDECSGLDIELGHVGCTINVSWEGCFEMNSWEWIFTPSTGNSLDCGSTGIPQPAEYDIVSETSNIIDGIGSMEIEPSVDGCYTFIINCNENCSDSISVEFEACCSPDAEIVLEDSPGQLCDYCYVNECTDSLLEIYVVIDDLTVPLSSFDEFNFPYCDNNNPNDCDSECGDLPTFDILVYDINTWLTNYGYEGVAQEGNGPSACKGDATPFWIEQTDIIFSMAYLWEYNNTNDYEVGYQMHPFIEDNCNGTNDEGMVLKVVGACIGADYLWSTGETSQYIPYQSGLSYSVTITCPDGCTEILNYGGNAGNSLKGNFSINDSKISRIVENENFTKSNSNNSNTDIQFYPNPANSKVYFKVTSNVGNNLEVKLYTTQGMLVANHTFPKSQNNVYEIDVASFKSGVYLITVDTQGLVLSKEKIVIIK